VHFLHFSEHKDRTPRAPFGDHIFKEQTSNFSTISEDIFLQFCFSFSANFSLYEQLGHVQIRQLSSLSLKSSVLSRSAAASVNGDSQPVRCCLQYLWLCGFHDAVMLQVPLSFYLLGGFCRHARVRFCQLPKSSLQYILTDSSSIALPKSESSSLPSFKFVVLFKSNNEPIVESTRHQATGNLQWSRNDKEENFPTSRL